MTDVARCPRCRTDHPKAGPCPLDTGDCGSRFADSVGRAAACILEPAHRGPHWGPIRGGGYHEWRTS